MNLTTLGTIATGYVGTPYIYGGANPIVGLDCSGFVQIPLKKVGILYAKKRFWSQAIYNELLKRQFKSSIPCADCVLFFGKDRESITHVAIALDETYMIEARGGDSTTSSMHEAIKKEAMVEITRIDRRKDLVASIKVIY